MDQDRLALGLATAYAEDTHRGYGASMHDVLRRIGAGEPWREVVAGQFGSQGSWGNGAAMRAAPLGAWHAVDLDVVAEQAACQGAVSHHHPEAIAAAVAVALAAALATRSRGGPAPARPDFLQAVAERLPESDVRSGVRIAARMPEHTSVRHAAEVLGSGYRMSGPDTAPYALWCAAGHLGDLHEGLWLTVAGRGDIDTTCAIAGGVIAARTGVAALPLPGTQLVNRCHQSCRRKNLYPDEFRRLQQISAHPRVRKASWMSSRISQRIRRRRNQCRWANVRSTTQRWVPSPEPFGASVGDHRFHSEIPGQTAVLVVVVATVAQHDVRAAPGPASLAPHRWYRLE